MTDEVIHKKFEEYELSCAVDLMVSSPPYGIGKEYEDRLSIESYTEWATLIVKKIGKTVRDGGVVCWQVGNYVEGDGSIMPLDVLFIPLFVSEGFRLINRIIWRFGHGLHAKKKLSGRYETLLCFVKGKSAWTFNLDEVRQPSKYPAKRSYKGAKKGQISSNPLGCNPSDVWDILACEWETGIMDIPQVKNNHIEKTTHPCQFPIELAERCVLLFSNPGDTVIDPFSGSGTVGVAATFHERKTILIESDANYVMISKERVEMAKNGTLRSRALGKPIHSPNTCSALARLPQEWIDTQRSAAKKPRLVSTPLQEATSERCDKPQPAFSHNNII